MSLWHSSKRLIFGIPEGLAGTVYGTVVVMGAITAGSGGSLDLRGLAAIVGTTVLVLWLAHVYAHGLGESIERGRRLDSRELREIARRELAIPLAAVAPIAVLVLGAAGVFKETSAVWLALGVGLLTLAVEGVRYARIERIGLASTVVVVALNLVLGLVIVALKAALAH